MSSSLAGTQRRSKHAASDIKTDKTAPSKRLSSHVKQRGLEQSDVETEEKLRREFDLETKFGPVSGLTRMERWERAARMGLEPPAWVKDAIMREGLSSDTNAHLFTRGKV